MGGINKRQSWLRLFLLCLTTVVALLAGWSCTNIQPLMLMAENGITPPTASWTGSGVISGQYSYTPNTSTRELHIQDESELAFFNYQIANNVTLPWEGGSYDDWKIVLARNMNMGAQPNSAFDAQVPIWEPIPMSRQVGGETVSTKNLIFDGNGYSIENLTIKVNVKGNINESVNVGMFTNLIGGMVQNVTFVNPNIVVNYIATEQDAGVLTEPVEVSVGVIAGKTEGTRISNVKIVNPSITVNTQNYNGHSFYVGGAVGQINDYYGNTTAEKIKPDVTVLDSVNLSGGYPAANQPWSNGYITLDIDNGGNGLASEAYLGGLVGANYSSRIDNCKLENVALKMDLMTDSNTVKGTYYAGGLAGMATTRARYLDAKTPINNSVMFSGLVNNIVMVDVNLVHGAVNNTGSEIHLNKEADIAAGLAASWETAAQTVLNHGLIAGRVWNDWLHSNIYVGENHTAKLFGCCANEQLVFFKGDDICLAHDHQHYNILSDYFVHPTPEISEGDEENEEHSATTYTPCQLVVIESDKNSGGVVYYPGCVGAHRNSSLFLCDPSKIGAEIDRSLINEANYAIKATDYEKLINAYVNNAALNAESLGVNTGVEFFQDLKIGKFNSFEANGNPYLYRLGRVIEYYDHSNNDPEDTEIRSSVNDYRIWEVKVDANTNTKSLEFGYYVGKNYTVTFDATSGGWLQGAFDNKNHYNPNTHEYYFNEDEEYGSYRVTKSTKEKKYRESIEALRVDERPVRTGYKLFGWARTKVDDEMRVTLSAVEKNEYITNNNIILADVNLGSMESNDMTFYAVWQRQAYTVNFYWNLENNQGTYLVYSNTVANADHEGVPYGVSIDDPVLLVDDVGKEHDKDGNPIAPIGMRFAGWFDAPEGGQKIVDFRQTSMPGCNYNLYAHWIDNYADLREKMETVLGTDEKGYFADKPYYTKESFDAFKAVYEDIRDKMSNDMEVDAVQDCIDDLDAAVNGLIVNVDLLKVLEPLANEDLDANKYSFLYTADSYDYYMRVRRTMLGYLEGFDKTNTLIAGNVEMLKNNIDLINKVYKDLVKNPHISGATVDQTAVQNIITEYNSLNASLDNIAQEDYEVESWRAFSTALSTFLEEFAKDSPHIADLQGAISKLKTAEANLVRVQNTDNDNDTTTNKKPNTPNVTKVAMPVSPILIGVVVMGVLVAAAGGVITFDVLRRKKKHQEAVAEAKASESEDDNYI